MAGGERFVPVVRIEPRCGGFVVSPARKRRGGSGKVLEPRSGDQMAHTYTLQIMHCVFSTKGRLLLIADPSGTWDILPPRRRQR